MTGCRVLLVYPNERDMSLVPPVFGLFAALLRERGHIVEGLMVAIANIDSPVRSQRR